MGTVISRTASADSILRDGKVSHENAAARGGRVAEIADLRLAPVLALVASIDAERSTLAGQVVTLRASRDAEVAAARAAIDECYDAVWNRVGRPAVDPQLDLLFPGGAGAYTDGPVAELPDRMSVLSDLLGRGLHPRISVELATEWRTKIDAARTSVSSALTALSAPATRLSVLTQVHYALARSLATALQSMKRDLKSEGFNEAAIHQLIPDHPRSSPKAAKQSAQSAPSTPIPAAPAPAAADPHGPPTRSS